MVKSGNNVRTCSKCGRLFQPLAENIFCPECYKAMEEKFREVKKYIRDHKDAGVYKVSMACNVPEKQVLAWIREERLLFSEESGVGIPCMSCGMPIQLGKYCDVCKKKIKKDLTGVLVKHETPDDQGLEQVSVRTAQRLRFENRGKK